MERAEKQFLEAYDAHADAIYRHCYFRIFSKAAAEDCVQETFMKAWQYVKDGNRVENMRAFLYRVATNVVIDAIRKRRESSLEDHLDSFPNDEPAQNDREILERQLLMGDVRKGMEQLPPEAREVLTLRFIDDLEPREIAKVLSVSPNAVSVRIHRALQSLKAVIPTSDI